MTTTPTTKRTAPAKAGAEQKPAATPAAEPIRRTIEFNDVQLQIIDALSDLLVSGGTNKNLDTLIGLALDHSTRRQCSYISDLYLRQGRDFEQEVEKRALNLGREWRLDVDLAIRKNKRAPEPERQQPADVSGMIRATLRDSIEFQFKTLMLLGSMNDLYFLQEVLIAQASGGNVDIEVPLAHAFNLALGHSDTFVRIPESMRLQVQKYIDCLHEIEGKEV